RNVNVSVPPNCAAGVYVTWVPLIADSVPFFGPATIANASGSFSTSVALSVIVTGSPAVVLALTSVATGGSLTAVTVIVTVTVVDVAVPSLALYVNESVPLKSCAPV